MSDGPDFAKQREQLVARQAEVQAALAEAEASLGATTLDRPESAAVLATQMTNLQTEKASLAAALVELDRRELQAKAEAAEVAKVKASRALAIDLSELAKAGADLVAAIGAMVAAVTAAEALEGEAHGHARDAGLEVRGPGVRQQVVHLVAAAFGIRAFEEVDRLALRPAIVEQVRAGMSTKRTTKPRAKSAWAA